MRVVLTGTTGFAGRWLKADLEAAGHEVIPAPGRGELDLAGNPDFGPFLAEARPDAVAHLAAISYAPDATAAPELAMRVNAGGTAALCSALDAVGSGAALLVTGSSEVYGIPDPADLPLKETAPLRTEAAYGLSKLAQERVALEAATTGRRVVVTRAFNHLGPGQRPRLVAPAMARRVLDVRDGRAATIPVGNLDARRDFTDVRDTVAAYRLLLEALVAGRVPVERPVYNVATGVAVSVRELVATLCRLAGIEMATSQDLALVRPNDPPEIRGDARALRSLTGWAPAIPLEASLGDLLRSLSSDAAE